MTKRKRILRVFLVIGVGIFIVAVLGIVVLRSRAFHRYVLARMTEEAAHSTGGRVEIGGFDFAWSGLRLNLYHIVLHGAEPASLPPLLQADHLRVGLKIISLWRRKVDVNDIVIDHPSIHLSVDPSGATNLPHSPPAAPAAPGTHTTNVFNLAIGHFVVNGGELNYRDRHIPLNAELHDFHAQVDLSSFRTAYTGVMGYRDGRIQYGDFNPLQHSIEARFEATPAGLALDSVVLDAGASSLSLQARLRDYRNPSVEGSYQGNLSTAELGEILKIASLPIGQVNLQGTLNYAGGNGQALLNNLTLAGQFQSPDLAVKLPQARASVRALNGDYRLSGGTLEVRNVQAGVLGGRASGNLTVAHLSDRPEAKMTAQIHDVSLGAISTAVGASQIKRAAIAGKLRGTLEGSWVGAGQNLRLHSDATVTASAPVGQNAGPGASAIPLEGAIHLTYDGPSGVISLAHTELTTSHTSVRLDGSTGKRSSLSIQAHSSDLGEVDQLVLIARHAASGGGAASGPSPQPLGIGGSGSFDGQLRGTMKNPRLTGRLSSTNLQYRGTSISGLQVDVALSPSEVTLSQGQMQTGDQGQIQFNAAAGLTTWSYTPQSQIRLDMTAARVPVATVEKLANLHYPVTGTLGARISMHGSQLNLTGQGSTTLAQGMVWGQPIQNLSVQFEGAGSSVRSTLQFQTPAGSGSGKLAYDFKSQGYDAELSVPHLQLEKLQALNRGKLHVTGVVTASAQGKGTLKDPQLAATLQASRLVVDRQTLDGLKLQANVAQQKAALTLDTGAQGASIQGRANIDLNANYDTTAHIDVRDVQLGPLLASFLPQAPAGLQGHTEAHASLHGPLKHREQIEAVLDIPTVNLAYQSLQIANVSPLHAVYRGGVVTLDKCELKGTGSDLQLQASIPVAHPGSLKASATGNIDLHLIQLFYPEWNSAGQVRLEIAADGAPAHPNVNGTVRVADAVIQPTDMPIGAEKLNAEFAIHNGRIDIQKFTGEAGGGTLSVQGFATYQPAILFNVRLSAKQVRLRYPVGTRAILDSSLLLAGSRESALLSGRVVIDRVSLTRDFDLSTFADQFTASPSASPGPSFAQNVRLNVAVRSASEMEVANSKLTLQGSANLTVQGTAAEPVILGRTDINEGEIFFNKQRYLVESGVIQFVNPVHTEPVLNLHASTTVNQFNITLNFTGPIDRLHVSYASDPPLAPIDIINLLATGKTTEAASTSPTTPQSVIAGQLTSQFSNRVEKLAGISSLTIDPQVGSGQGNGVGRLAVQQRVTKNLFFSFSTDLTNSAGQSVQVEYQVTPRFAVSTIRDQNGIYTVQVKMHKSF